MAERRMFSKTLIDSDAFLDMPLSAQSLYFHLSMRADDDGFINNAQKIIRMINASKNDFDLLILKKFIIKFDDGICVITHWKLHNYIRSDRYKATIYKENLRKLITLENKAYSLNEEIINKVNNNGIPEVSPLDTQNSIDKDNLDKVRKGKRKNKQTKGKIKKDTKSKSKVNKEIIDSVIQRWNSLKLTRLISIKNTRLELLNARINEYGIDKVLETIDSISRSKFLQGNNDRNWTITIDWFLKPSNFTKVIEGNYLDKEHLESSKEQHFQKHIPGGHDLSSLEKKLLGWDSE